MRFDVLAKGKYDSKIILVCLDKIVCTDLRVNK